MCGAMSISGPGGTFDYPDGLGGQAVRRVDPSSEALVKYATELCDLGKQPAEILHLLLAVYAEEPPETKRRCRVCGCTDDSACPPTCWWVADDLCSSCAPGQPEDTTDSRASEVRP